MAWQKEIDETKHRRHLAEQMGGAEAVARQHAQGKLTVRERIAALADPGSIQEMGSFTGRATYDRDRMVTFMPSRAVIGVSTLNGRKVVIGAGDATIPGGAAYASTGYKMGSAQKLALEWHLPYVRLLDSFGSSVLDIEGVSRTYFLDADTTDETLRLFGAVPVVSAVMGSVEGLPAA